MGKERIQWLALLRGLNILLVVMFHVQLIDMATGENHQLCRQLSYPFNPFRMPLFIFCSGGLLYLSRIRKDWPIKELYVDKVKRIVVPFVFFVSFYYFFKLLMNPFTKTKVVFSVGDFLESFCIYYGHPSSHLWFLPVLFWFMLLYPLFRHLCESTPKMLLFLAATVAFYFVDLSGLSDYNYFYLFSLNQYLVWFFCGIVFFRYQLYSYLQTWQSCILTAVVYVLCYYDDVPLLTPLSGILLMISLSQQLARFCPTLFSSYREYIYQIFLMSFIFQPFVELVLWKRLFYNEQLFPLFYVLNVLFGLYLPVIVSKLVERSNIRWLKMCIGLS